MYVLMSCDLGPGIIYHCRFSLVMDFFGYLMIS